MIILWYIVLMLARLPFVVNKFFCRTDVIYKGQNHLKMKLFAGWWQVVKGWQAGWKWNCLPCYDKVENETVWVVMQIWWLCQWVGWRLDGDCQWLKVCTMLWWNEVVVIANGWWWWRSGDGSQVMMGGAEWMGAAGGDMMTSCDRLSLCGMLTSLVRWVDLWCRCVYSKHLS